MTSQPYIVLARKYRPQHFKDLVGQDTITKTFQNAITLGRVPHAILLTGTRGVGKTTTARILAKALNCINGPTIDPCNVCDQCKEITAGSHVDVLEIDGASNTSVDDVRDLRETVRYTPAKSKYKIYIIDEVHMLSNSAFNALLKTLEEPPSGVIFIFATTEVQKIPDTILSRCQRFDFKSISEEQIARHLKAIAQKENIQVSEVSLGWVARQAQGSMRDGLSLLDQVLAFSDPQKGVQEDEVIFILGLTDRKLIEETLYSFIEHDSSKALQTLKSVFEQGFDLKNYCLEILEKIRDLMLLKSGGSLAQIRATQEDKQTLLQWSQQVEFLELVRWFEILKSAVLDLGRVLYPHIVLEVNWMKITQHVEHTPVKDILAQLEALSKSGVALAVPSALQGSSFGTKPVVNSQPPLATSNVASSPGAPSARSTPAIDPQWNRVVQKIKETKPSFAAVLLQSQEHHLDDTTLTLKFPKGSFYLTRAQETEFQKELLRILEEVLGKKMSLQVGLTQASAAGPVAAAVPQSETDRKAAQETLRHPMVQKAVSMFEAKVEDVKHKS